MRQIEEAAGGQIQDAAFVGGGDINDSSCVTLDDGRRLFVKTNPRPPAGMFEVEARGLAFLREGLSPNESLIVPEALAYGDSFLLMDYLEPARGSGGEQAEQLGRGLAALHQNGPERFGLDHDNFIGTLPQNNEPLDDWAQFYGERRLRAQLEMSGAKRLITGSLRKRLERLIERLDDLVGPPEPPARLHGDLWGGNWLATSHGPAIIDPAVYGGHREVDLAMMRLFGGYPPRTFAAYEEVAPLSPGHEERVRLYQLYPLLVHVNLFGGGYVGQVEAALSRYE